MKNQICHKADYKRKFSKYVGFGKFERLPSALCRGPKGFYSKRPPGGYAVRNWKDVTCLQCLKKKLIPK